MIPAVSICVPTRDRAASLRATLRAIFAQTFQDFEVIVGDDASSDDTPKVVREFDQGRLRYLHHPVNLGIYQNWNTLVAEARGRYVCIYHDHDTYLPTIVERSAALLDAHADMSFVHTAIVLTDKTGTPIDVFAGEFDEVTPGRVLQDRFSRTTRNTLCAATTMVRREAYQAAGPFEPAYGLPADRQMWVRLAAQGSVGYVSEPQALILGRSKGDPTERFALQDLLGNYRITVDTLGALWPPASLERWCIEQGVAREVQRDLFVGVLKSMASGTPADVRARLALATPAMAPILRPVARAVSTWPLRPLVGLTAGWLHARSLKQRQDKAIEYCRRSPTLSSYLPSR